MKRPIIGMTTALIRAKWSVWDAEVTLIDSRYINAVDRVGGLPVLLPPNGGSAADVVACLDGMLFIGGADVNPEFYGAKPHPLSKPVPKRLDEWNLQLMKAAIAANVPFLGICRGLQLLNVLQGGTLHQHLPDVLGHDKHALAPGVKGKHIVRIAKGSVLEPIMGLNPSVTSYHHQAADKIGHDLEPIAWSEEGIVEGLRLTTHPWAIGVQWHAEEDDYPLLEKFMEISSQNSM